MQSLIKEKFINLTDLDLIGNLTPLQKYFIFIKNSSECITYH